jgi:hypothetical protein
MLTILYYIYMYSACIGLDNKLYKMHGTYIKIVPHNLQVRRPRNEAPCGLVSLNKLVTTNLLLPPHLSSACTTDYPLNYITPPCSTLCRSTPSLSRRMATHTTLLTLLRLATPSTCHYALCDVDTKSLPVYILNNGRSLVRNFNPRNSP